MNHFIRHFVDDIVAFVSGIAGGSAYLKIAGITWQDAWQNIEHLLWLGFVAMFTGAMGVIGRHLIIKYFKKKK